MDYFIIFILQVLGIGFHVGKKVYEIDKIDPHDSLNDVFSAFWREDRITVFISGLILLFNMVLHFILDYYDSGLTEVNHYHLYAFGLAFLLGYTGQSLIYKALGKAEKLANDKIDGFK